MSRRPVSIVVSELCKMEGVLIDFVHDPVFIGNATGPISRQTMSEGLWLAGSFKGGALYFLNELVDALKELSVGPLPVEIIFPGMLGEDDLHSINSRSMPPPDSSSTIDSRSLRAFFGLLRRYAVSSRAW
jgi:hypothetical protein